MQLRWPPLLAWFQPSRPCNVESIIFLPRWIQSPLWRNCERQASSRPRTLNSANDLAHYLSVPRKSDNRKSSTQCPDVRLPRFPGPAKVVAYRKPVVDSRFRKNLQQEKRNEQTWGFPPLFICGLGFLCILTDLRGRKRKSRPDSLFASHRDVSGRCSGAPSIPAEHKAPGVMLSHG